MTAYSYHQDISLHNIHHDRYKCPLDAYKRELGVAAVLLDLVVPVVAAAEVAVVLLDLLALVVAEVVVATVLLVFDGNRLLSYQCTLYYNS